jgi:CheY-like chemotaxis protein
VYLPHARGEAEPLVHPETVIMRDAGELVLIVEDEPALRELAKMIREGLGYRAAVSSGGGAALALVEMGGLRPDVVLTDVVMPGMSGRARGTPSPAPAVVDVSALAAKISAALKGK